MRNPAAPRRWLWFLVLAVVPATLALALAGAGAWLELWSRGGATARAVFLSGSALLVQVVAAWTGYPSLRVLSRPLPLLRRLSDAGWAAFAFLGGLMGWAFTATLIGGLRRPAAVAYGVIGCGALAWLLRTAARRRARLVQPEGWVLASEVPAVAGAGWPAGRPLPPAAGEESPAPLPRGEFIKYSLGSIALMVLGAAAFAWIAGNPSDADVRLFRFVLAVVLTGGWGVTFLLVLLGTTRARLLDVGRDPRLAFLMLVPAVNVVLWGYLVSRRGISDGPG